MMARPIGSAGILFAVVAHAGCSNDQISERSAMNEDRPPSWQKMYDGQKEHAKEHITNLIESSATYERISYDDSVVQRDVNNQIALVDNDSGDMIIMQTVDKERRLIDLRYTTKSGKLVCIFMTEWGGGHFMKWDKFPIRVYRVKESEKQTDEVIEARKRISIAQLGKFINAYPMWKEYPDRQFVIIDAPVQGGERL